MDVQKLYKAGCAHKEASVGGAIAGGIGGTVLGGVQGFGYGGGLGLTLAALFAKKEKMLGAMKKGAIIGGSIGGGLGAVGGAAQGAVIGYGIGAKNDIAKKIKTVAAKQKSS